LTIEQTLILGNTPRLFASRQGYLTSETIVKNIIKYDLFGNNLIIKTLPVYNSAVCVMYSRVSG